MQLITISLLDQSIYICGVTLHLTNSALQFQSFGHSLVNLFILGLGILILNYPYLHDPGDAKISNIVIQWCYIVVVEEPIDTI